MTTFQLKILAMVLMVIDHIGAFLFPDILILRFVGRLSFPLFAWLIANGAIHTSNIQTYGIRLFLFALISQIPFALVMKSQNPIQELNVFFTLFIGLVAIISIKKIPFKFLKIIIIIGLAIIAEGLNTDYGAAGVLSIVIFFVFFKAFWKMLIMQLVIFSAFYCIPGIYMILNNYGTFYSYSVALFEPFGVAALFFIHQYNGLEGRKLRYVFYAFYPVHLLILFLIQLLFGLPK